jgi:hypothetical protein
MHEREDSVRDDRQKNFRNVNKTVMNNMWMDMIYNFVNNVYMVE